MARTASRVGPYEILSRLGAGGMAETYVALRRGPGAFQQRVCLKRIRRDLEQDPEFVRQFLSEATIAATLRHANVAQVLDFGNEGDDYYLALELIDGLDLRELIETADHGLDPRLALFVAIEVTTALDFAHRSSVPGGSGGIVHRDISPSNVLVSIEGEVKLADFGIARPLLGEQHTRTGVIKGKTSYMAPEYARTARFDARCDLFALGVLLYECLSGTRPYDGDTDLETFERAARGEHVPLTTLAAAAPLGFVEIAERLIAPDPALRFQSAAEVLDALLALPSDGTARRDLGALVRRAKAERGAGAPGGASDAGPAALAAMARSDRDVAQSPTRTLTADAGTRAGADPRASPSGGRAQAGPWLALAAAVLVAGAVIALAGRNAPVTPLAPAAPARESPAAPAPPAAALDAPVSPSAAPPEPVVQRGAPPAPPPERSRSATFATLRVVVVPFGDVVIDGRRHGPAPVQTELPAGEHSVVANTNGTRITRTITLRAGEHRDLTLR